MDRMELVVLVNTSQAFEAVGCRDNPLSDVSLGGLFSLYTYIEVYEMYLIFIG